MSMMKPRVSEMPQRQSPRVQHQQRTTSSESDPLPRRTITRSVKVGDRRSPRGSQSDPPTHKKLGTRISDLENQLGQAQQELKSLKKQLASAEAAKQEDQTKSRDEVPHRETDVFEVPDPHPSVNSGKASLDENKEELSHLKAMLEEKEKENGSLKKQVEEAALKQEEVLSKLVKLEEELEASKASVFDLSEKVEAAEEAKGTLEEEMKKLRVQTDQWRKAADAAAAVLSGGVEVENGKSMSDRCGSMDKHFNGIFELGSPGALEEVVEDGFGVGGGGKRKGSGIKMFGDLWKKKGHR